MVLHLRAEITHPKKLHCLKLYISVPHKKGDKICALVSLGFHELLARCPLCNIKELSMMMKFALQRIRLSVLPGGH